MQRIRSRTALAAVATITMSFALPTFAADTGDSTNSKTGANAAVQSGTTAPTGAMQGSPGTMPGGATALRGTATVNKAAADGSGNSFDKTGSDAGMHGWAESHARTNQGRVSRQAYMDEAARRWDAMDGTKQGLTPAEVSRMYGNVDSGAMPAKTGTGAQPGNMGPGNQKGQ